MCEGLKTGVTMAITHPTPPLPPHLGPAFVGARALRGTEQPPEEELLAGVLSAGCQLFPGHHQIYLLIGPHCEAQGPFWSKTLSSSRVAGKEEAPLSFQTPMRRSQQAARMGSRGGASPAPATSSLGQKAEPRPCLGGQGRLRAFDTLPHLCLTCLCLHGTYMTSGIAFLFGVVTSNFIEMHIF